MSTPPFFEQELSHKQLEAVEHFNGPLLILAGAGSGKTRALTYRVVNLVLQGEATPGQILAMTFTNKAAQEMKTRMYKLLNRMNVPTVEEFWVSTFHSFCAKVLRQHIYLLGYRNFFAIYSDGDQLSLLKKILRKLNINEKMYDPKGFRAKINTIKTQGIPPKEVSRKAPYLMDERDIMVYSEYELEMKRANALDFTDLLYKTHELFETHPEVLQIFQKKFRYIMVDEYQDTNHIQYLLVRRLSEAHKNICVVGDEDQSIYSWRGADIRNILDFEKDFADAKVIKLEENHRSTKNIVEAASKVIANNQQRKDKVLFTNHPRGEPIHVCGHPNDHQEAQYVVQTIQSLVEEKETDAYKDFAVFYRTNAQSRVLEDQLRHHSIPYKLVGGIKFYERKEIKDILAYMKLALNPSDDVAFKRIINTPVRGIGKTTIEQLETFAQERNLSLIDACLSIADQGILYAATCKKLHEFHKMIKILKNQAHKIRVSEIYHLILDLTQYVQKLRRENTNDSLSRIDNLEEFNNAILQFENEGKDEKEEALQGFVEKMSLVSDSDHLEDSFNAVTLMTLHVSKGLEYPNVFIVGMEEGLFPTTHAIDNGASAIEEERRLAYVGMTRAEKQLFLTHAQMRRVWGKEQMNTLSRFIEEIPENYKKSKTHKFSQSRQRYNPKRKWDPDSSDDFDYMPNYEDECERDMSPYRKGMRVRHPKFGVGSIYRVEGQGQGTKVSIMFSNRRAKKFVARLTPLERV